MRSDPGEGRDGIGYGSVFRNVLRGPVLRRRAAAVSVSASLARPTARPRRSNGSRAGAGSGCGGTSDGPAAKSPAAGGRAWPARLPGLLLRMPIPSRRRAVFLKAACASCRLRLQCLSVRAARRRDASAPSRRRRVRYAGEPSNPAVPAGQRRRARNADGRQRGRPLISPSPVRPATPAPAPPSPRRSTRYRSRARSGAAAHPGGRRRPSTRPGRRPGASSG